MQSLVIDTDPGVDDAHALMMAFAHPAARVAALTTVAGNVTATAEFNTYSDPEAAAVVLEAWPGLELISWETTLELAFSAQQLQALMSVDTPRGEFFRRITGKTLHLVCQYLGREGLYAPDGLTMAVALEPGLVRRCEEHYVQVELCGQHTRGQMAVDWSGRSGRAPNVKVILEVDKQRLWELFRAGLD